MTDDDKELLKENGWTVECESPLEISHEDGSRATGQAVDHVICGLWASNDEECFFCGMDHCQCGDDDEDDWGITDFNLEENDECDATEGDLY